jgi:hypothetical protein
MYNPDPESVVPFFNQKRQLIKGMYNLVSYQYVGGKMEKCKG